MSLSSRVPLLSALVLGQSLMLASPSPARAAESYDNCTGFIDTLPATVSTQGTWCLRKDVSTSVTTGQAILINANNVTLDCNDFKLGGLAAGVSTGTSGIATTSARQNITIRNCNVRGFQYGVFLTGDNHTVVDSRFDLNTLVAIFMNGDGNEVSDTVVSATGGRPLAGLAMGIALVGDGGRVLDNRVHGVSAQADDGGANQMAAGIHVQKGVAIGNVITGLDPEGDMHGIRMEQGVARDNVIAQSQTSPNSWGIVCLIDGSGFPSGFADDNTIRHFANAHNNCSLGDESVAP